MTKDELLSKYDKWSEDGANLYSEPDVKEIMDEWAKQTATALFEEIQAMFDKRERELWKKIEPNLKPAFKYRLYGEVPAETEVIDKWYEQYLEKLETNKP